MNNSKSFMLSIIGIIAVIVFSFISTSCSQNEIDEFSKDMTNDPSSEIKDMVNYLSNEYGFSTENISITNNSIIVENDISFDIDNFWDIYSLSTTQTRAHYRSSNIISSNHRYILITAPQTGDPGEVPTDWLVATINAISAWESLGGDISFTLSKNDPYNAVIAVVYWDTGEASNVVATAAFPDSNGKPGSYVRINPNFSGTLTANEKTWVMIHELGHCLGFKHTDGGSGILLNSGDQNTTDATSVMQSVVISNPTPPYFTQYDIAAYNLLYP